MSSHKLIRKSHRYLGIFLGIQFIFWTVSGLYFSWTNIDEIHGDHFKAKPKKTTFNNLKPIHEVYKNDVSSIELRDIQAIPHYWINNEKLINAHTGEEKQGITKEEAIAIASNHIRNDLKVKNVTLLQEITKDHEYREKKLPAYVIDYEHKDIIKVYISQADGKFQTIRHKAWRWFDFLWMTHTMDFEGRDNINNIFLRIFSLLGLITVLSGFLLWFVSSPTLRKLKRKSIPINS
jgi:uncharacterized iron-regulated membrane protein